MCMKNYDAENIIFVKFTAIFNIFDHYLTIAYTIMVGSAYFVKSTPRAFSISFQYFADMFHTY